MWLTVLLAVITLACPVLICMTAIELWRARRLRGPLSPGSRCSWLDADSSSETGDELPFKKRTKTVHKPTCKHQPCGQAPQKEA